MNSPFILCELNKRFIVNCPVIELSKDVELYIESVIKDGTEDSEFYNYFYEMQPDEINDDRYDIYFKNRIKNFLKFKNNEICFDVNDSSYNSNLELYFTINEQLIGDWKYPNKTIGITLKTKRSVKLLDINYFVFTNTNNIKYYDYLLNLAKDNQLDGVIGFNDRAIGNRFVTLFDTANTCNLENIFDINEYNNIEYNYPDEEARIIKQTKVTNKLIKICFSMINNSHYTMHYVDDIEVIPKEIYKYNSEYRDIAYYKIMLNKNKLPTFARLIQSKKVETEESEILV